MKYFTSRTLPLPRRWLEKERPGSHVTPYPASPAAFLKQLPWATVSRSKKTTWKPTTARHGFQRSPEHRCQAPSGGQSAPDSHLLGSRAEHANEEVTYWSDDQRNAALMATRARPPEWSSAYLNTICRSFLFHGRKTCLSSCQDIPDLSKSPGSNKQRALSSAREPPAPGQRTRGK